MTHCTVQFIKEELADALLHRPLTDIDPLDQDMRFDDFRRYEQIRQAGGIAWSPARGGAKPVPKNSASSSTPSV